MASIDRLIERVRGFAVDHRPNGWPAISMADLTKLCDAVKSHKARADILERRNDRLRAEIERLEGVQKSRRRSDERV
jgi:hypothetical protein